MARFVRCLCINSQKFQLKIDVNGRKCNQQTSTANTVCDRIDKMSKIGRACHRSNKITMHRENHQIAISLDTRIPLDFLIQQYIDWQRVYEPIFYTCF